MPDMTQNQDTVEVIRPNHQQYPAHRDRSQSEHEGAMPFLQLFGILYHYVIISTTGDSARFRGQHIVKELATHV